MASEAYQYNPDPTEELLGQMFDQAVLNNALLSSGKLRLQPTQKGLIGKHARILVDEPTDEIDWPANLPEGTKEVVILDDEPNIHHTLRVHPVDDPSRVALVVYDQLAPIDSQD